MTLLSLLTITAPVALCPPQDDGPSVPVDRVLTPVEVVVGPPPTPEASAETDVPWFQAASNPVQQHDDSVPLPGSPVFQTGPDGDVQLQPASGDPYFLNFAGGSYYPPENELVDGDLMQRYVPARDARPGDFTYAHVMFSKRMTDARIQQLEALGCRVLGFHPHYTLKVALDPDVLPTLSTLPFVRWVGSPERWQKLSPHSSILTDAAAPDEVMPFWVSVWESDMNARSLAKRIGRVDLMDLTVQTTLEDDDQRPVVWKSNGWMQEALETRGIQVERYAPGIDAFQVMVTREQLGLLTELDFVLFVEPVLEPTLASAPHDESTAMVMSDRMRSYYNGATNQVAIMGIIDSGVETAHSDLSLWGVGWSCAGDDPWNDDVSNGGSGHGTHCSGTILGRGVSEADHLGNAPGLASWGGTSRYFNFRGFSPGTCLNGTIEVATNIFANSFDDGTSVTARPHVVSNSWGYTLAGAPIGSEANCRTLDSAVYDNGQLYVFATGNEGSGSGTCRIEGSAKNVLSVGSIVDYIDGAVGDPGNLWTSSSRGPCGDNRWKPNIVAPGRQIRSAVANNNTGYANYSGTSMATPHVSAAAATLCDHYSWVRYQPALLSSMLMATAITDNDQTLTFASDAHLDTYGTGRLNSYKSHYNTSDFQYIGNWNFDQTNANWFFSDFTVPVGTTRLVCVMRYVEDQCSPGAGQALVNDYDLWIDRDPIDGAGNSGEFSAQQSQVDNTEIRIVNNPIAGLYRWKTYPDSASGDVVRMAITIYAVLDDTTPDATMTLAVDDSCVKPGELVNATATVDGTSYISSAVVLDRSGSFATLQSSSTTLYDGVVTDLLDSNMAGNDIVLGDILYSNDRAGTWGLTYGSEGVKSITVNARSDNMVDKLATVNVTVDGTQPGLVGSLQSSSHTVGAWSNDPTITWTWNSAFDALSGLQGYGIFEFTSCSIPGALLDIGPVTSFTSGAYGSSTSGRYFNIRSVDNCDNWDADYACVGPYYIDVTTPGAPTFNSSTHTVGGTSCDPNITVNWNAAADAHSGITGYSYTWSGSATTCPNASVDTTGTSVSSSISSGTWYLHVRARDVAGNWASCTDVGHFGPFHFVPTCELFFDDFESGDLAAGGWKTKNAFVSASPKAARTGAYGMRIKKKQWAQKSIDTTGYQNIVVTLSRRSKNYDTGEDFRIRWSVGAGWNDIDVTQSAAWQDLTFNLPAGASNNPNFKIRIKSRGNEAKENGDIDDITVTATSL